MILAHRLTIPDNTVALLCDMDGVLIDSLTFDYEVCNQILHFHTGTDTLIAPSLIRELFPLDVYEFWRQIITRIKLHVKEPQQLLTQLAAHHDTARQTAHFPVHHGIREVLTAARQQQLHLAVVSNNLTHQIKAILLRAGLLDFFAEIVGNDREPMRKKPAPDFYLLAAKLLGVAPQQCVVIEDSLVGAQAGHTAGCYTVGLAMGADSYSKLVTSPLIDCAYTSLAEWQICFTPGAVTTKSIITPNEFVSHMIEHLAWRLGCTVTVQWNNSDWVALGRAVGKNLAQFPRRANSAAVMGMIDDGSAEIRLTVAPQSKLAITATAQIDLAWFLASRCEQLASGQPLVDFLEGMATAFPLWLEIMICSFEDPHHTWEGIFRAVGIALERLLLINAPTIVPVTISEPTADSVSVERHWLLLHESTMAVELLRKTAESEVRVALDFTRCGPPQCHFQVDDSIQVAGLSELLAELTRHAHCQLDLEFKATRINSSHVVMEDTGMVIGRALKTILVQRMWHTGINGAGSNVTTVDDLAQLPIGVGLSIEGRKFWSFVPFYATHEQFRREFLIGHSVGHGLFSEDLDDFIDGFAGGISGSIMVHVRHPISPQAGWPLIFRGLGHAIAEALAPNPARRGVPPGVKATLA